MAGVKWCSVTIPVPLVLRCHPRSLLCQDESLESQQCCVADISCS